jgi:hypothetical protein
VYHVEDFRKGILKNEQLLELGGRSREVGEYDEGFGADSVSGVVQGCYQAFDAAGGCEDAFLGPLGACQSDGAYELQRVEAGVEVGLLEEIDEQSYIVLPLS